MLPQLNVRERLLLLITGLAQERVLVVDDGFLAAHHTRFQVLSLGFPVVRALGRGEHVLSAVEELKPDILVMSVQLRGQCGVKLTRQLMDRTPLPIILLAKSRDEMLMKEALGSGACSYLQKSVAFARLSMALKFAAIHARRRYHRV